MGHGKEQRLALNYLKLIDIFVSKTFPSNSTRMSTCCPCSQLQHQQSEIFFATDCGLTSESQYTDMPPRRGFDPLSILFLQTFRPYGANK